MVRSLALEDKILQRAVVEVLNAVYEVDFLGFSYGFRPGRGPHHALDALTVGIERKSVNWVLDADIRDFFTSLDHSWLEKFLEHRIADQRVLRLIGKWLTAGVIEDGEWSQMQEGAPQGGLCSAEHNTYIPTWEGWLYLATVIDCHTKACIGYAMADHLRADLVIDALRMAARNYPLVEGAIFHSDYAELCVKPRDRALACVGGVA